MDEPFDDFTLAYIEAALWSSTDNTDEQGGEPLDANYDICDIAPDTLGRMKEQCAHFQKLYGDLLVEKNYLSPRQSHSVLGMAGHDFWLTRVGGVVAASGTVTGPGRSATI